MDDMTALGRKVLASQPFSALLEAELIKLDYGRAELKIPIRAELKQQHGFVHGGVLAYAADNALTFAGGSALGPGVVTAEFKINYFRPVMGEYIVARARVVHSGKTQAVCACEISVADNSEERLCASAQGTITRLVQPSANGA